jgi:hypothetical protein
MCGKYDVSDALGPYRHVIHNCGCNMYAFVGKRQVIGQRERRGIVEGRGQL